MPETSRYQHATFDTLHNRLRVTANLVAQTALRIGAGRASDVVSNDLPVLRDGRNRPFVPGASLKGAFRSQLEALLRAIAPAPATAAFSELDALIAVITKAKNGDKTIDTQIDRLPRQRWVLDFGQMEDRTKKIGQFKQVAAEKELADTQLSRVILRSSSLIDLTFGSPELAGRLFFKDALVDEQFWFDTFEVRNGVAINRDTETVEGSLLYDYEVVPAGTQFSFALTLEHAADWQLGMVLLGLRTWQRGGVQIGGFRSRGLGYIVLDNLALEYREVKPRDVDSALRLFCDCETLEAIGLAPEDDTLDEERWLKAFRKELGALTKEDDRA